MMTKGFSAEIRKVADNDKQFALFLSLALLFVWVVAVNWGVRDLTPRWFQRQFDWMASEAIPPIFLTMAIASAVIAVAFKAFSGNGSKLFEIDANGVVCPGLFGSKHYYWSDFESLERDVSQLILHLRPTARGSWGRDALIFDVSAIDCPGQRLEALIVHYRPDLYGAHVTRPAEARQSSEAPAARGAPMPQANVLSQRMARLR